MEMDDELENFIRERKARVAEDKACLQQDPPYMEMKAKPYRDFGYTVKENIPPKSKAEGKEESCSLGLPLGVEYERKKQRLQQELRMDYRRYMAQKNHFEPVALEPLLQRNDTTPVKQHLVEDQTGAVSKQKDAATLTRGSRRLYRLLRLAEDEEGRSSVLLRHRDRLGWLVGQESEEEDRKDELELTEDTSPRHVALDTNSENRQFTKTDGREDSAGVAREGRTSRARSKIEDAEFATGLLIGAADTREALRRRKERYRQELQEQMAEQYHNKKREKDLELNVAVTGMNDPEKQPDRIRQFGLSRGKGSQVSEPLPTGDRRPSSALPDIENIGAREREMPPPEQAHVAFQSPLLEYSSALGLGGGGLSPSSQPAIPSFPATSMDILRYAPFPPHPPPSVSDAYRSPYVEPHHYYGTRNVLGPNMAYYGHMPVSGAGLPIPYWNLPPGAPMPSQFGTHSPLSQHSGSSFPEPPVQSNRPSNETATGASQPQLFHSEKARSGGERNLSYREALKEQIQEKELQRRRQREESKRYEAQLEADMINHQPWGRGGGGAPLRDSTGNLIADLKQMHKLNEEAYINPERRQRRATAAMAACRTEHLDPNERVSGFKHEHTPQFARGKAFANQPTERQLQEQAEYKAFLQQQIEESRLRRAEEKERIKLEEKEEEKRLEEQRALIQREYEEEQERIKEKETEAKKEALAEERKKEAERKEKEAEEKKKAQLRRQYERERQARVDEVNRVPSPPIPTLQKKYGLNQYTPRPPTGDSQLFTVPLSERSLSGLQSPPVPACRIQLQVAGGPYDLSALRRQLLNEKKQLEEGDGQHLDSCLSSRNRECPKVDIFESARRKLQASVRRANSRNTEPQNVLRIHDSLRPKYRDYLDLSPPQQNDLLRSETRGSARGSLLESESAFIDLLGNGSSVPHTAEPEKTHQLSARERRWLSKQSQRPRERAASSQPIGHAANRQWRDVELGREWGNVNRTGHLKALSHRRNTAGPLDLSDDDSSPPQFSPHNGNRQGSVETVSTDCRMWPGTSDPLKCSDRLLRRERLAM